LRRETELTSRKRYSMMRFCSEKQLRALLSRSRAIASPHVAEIQHLNDAVERWHAAPKLDPQTLDLQKPLPGFEAQAALGRIAIDAVELFSARCRGLLRRCELDSCGAVFIDPGHGRPRKWCSMERCGNRSKVRAFRERELDK